MESVFSGEVEVLIMRSGREVARVRRPLRNTEHGFVIRYKKKFWRVVGEVVDLDHGPLSEGQTSEMPTAIAIELDDEDNALQNAVISAPAEERLFVDAGPGTGKTFVACSRVASLINDGTPASRILLVSFTRTAIREIRDRLEGYLSDPADAASVRIATLDSHAWSIHSGFSSDAKLSGSFDSNIQATLEKVLHDELVQGDLRRIRHLVVDEAQDIVGLRADLLLAIIDHLKEKCGVTVFADPAQAIYGFTEDHSRPETGAVFLDGLKSRDFSVRQLRKVHRTSDPKLLELFTGTRNIVLSTEGDAQERGSRVRGDIERLATQRIGSTQELDLAGVSGSTLVLARQRYEVLDISGKNAAVPHRLRMSGLPHRILPWVSIIFWDFTARRIAVDEFLQRWQDRITIPLPGLDATRAWKLLVETAGDSETLVDLHRLRDTLGRSSPPALFTSPEYGDEGPIIGTIHASKGREADDVCLYLPPAGEAGEDDNPDEEIRVLYVGATRARSRLSVGNSEKSQSGKADGRAWKRVRGDKLLIEVGRAHDLDAVGLVGTAYFTEGEAQKAQDIIRTTPRLEKLYASGTEALNWRLQLQTEDKQRIAVLSERVKADLREIAKFTDRWPQPGYLAYVRSIGTRSVVLRADDPLLNSLHEPWRSSGFLFAPMLAGFGWSRLAAKK
ncbi:UvrD-helicase domain-containing protein [Devosia sp.]|uniref:UvrD-helicase domain-containing protein n=1 Tax=Devosia sp. TaxID=1871048 RepID=UPI002931E988|nr:UvrD-helicase domain-containing protein [Devosia sp.]